MQFRHPVLDQRLSLTVRRRSHCWQLRGNIGRWCGPRISLGYFRDEGLARQFGVLIGRGLAASGLVKWWSPLDVWRTALAESMAWGDGADRKTLDALCPMWVRLSSEAAGAELRYLPAYSPDLNPI